jgi:hypothetical protein
MEDILAVDGDIIAYRTACVCEEDWEGACRSIIDSTLRQIATDSGISKMRIYLSGANNFRYEVAKTKPYKGNRSGMVAPKFLNYCKQYLEEKYNAIRMHGYEADDGIASDMVQSGAIHCGIDKDILQIPGRHYNYVKEEWQEVNQDEAILTLYRQVLMGDTSDNIPGLPRVGAKTAEKVILDPNTAASDAINYYKQVCMEKMPEVNPFEYFCEQLQLIQMRTDVNIYEIDFDVHCIVEGSEEGFEEQEGDFYG